MKIISGGQSGVDRAALDFCLENNIPSGGWCPKGRIAEDGSIADFYPLKETRTANYEERTRLNIIDSDASLVLYDSKMDKGTLYSLATIKIFDKPYLQIDFSVENELVSISNWLEDNKISTINIVGPRESENPGIYFMVKSFLKELWKGLD